MKVELKCEGKHAKFRCYVMGKPEPEIEWHWEGRPLLPDRRRLMYRDRDGGFVLKVLYCQAKDRGLYVCAARNSAGQTLSAVQLHVKGTTAPPGGRGQGPPAPSLTPLTPAPVSA